MLTCIIVHLLGFRYSLINIVFKSFNMCYKERSMDIEVGLK